MLVRSDFEQIYQDFFSDLMRIAYRVTYDMEAAEDVCQEAYIRLFDRLDKFPTRQDARYWLIRVVKNLSLNYYKKRKNEMKAVNRVKKQPVPQMKTGEELLLAAESEEEVRRALDQIPEKFRQVLVLKEYSGMNYREIGKVMGISEGNVKVRAFRARNLLEKLLSQEESHVSG